MDQKASLYQSVNTVKNNGCLEGYTTDPDGFLSALGPVSYTHLDVYKRQAIVIAYNRKY